MTNCLRDYITLCERNIFVHLAVNSPDVLDYNTINLRLENLRMTMTV